MAFHPEADKPALVLYAVKRRIHQGRSVSSPQPMNEQAPSALRIVLTSIERVLPPHIRATLRPPAEAGDLAGLVSSVPEVGQLPADVCVLFSWHDGQPWNSPLSRKDNRRLLSVSEIGRECSFFADPTSDFMEPWSPLWLPVLTNDLGDFVVYETAGPSRGKLLHYWHDDQSRSVAYLSLQEWGRGTAS